ncbi:MAG: hypothetical protein IPH75_14920 [bacterium]|nr:hypothetical protein [bacterium]
MEVVTMTLVLVILPNLLCAQTTGRFEDDNLVVTLKSFEGEPKQVHVYRDLWKSRLHCELDSQRICIEGYTGLDSLTVLFDHFLELKYRLRCGTVCRWGGYALICVSNGKLQLATPSTTRMYLERWPAWDCSEDTLVDPGYESALDERFFSVQSIEETYRLTIVDHYQFESPCEPDTNTFDTVQVPFNTEYGVFCTGLDTVSGKFESFAKGHAMWEDRSVRSDVQALIYQLYEEDVPKFFIDGYWWYLDVGTYFRIHAGECSD